MTKPQRLERERKFWDWYAAGHTVDWIAEQGQISRAMAYRVVRRALDRAKAALGDEVAASKARQVTVTRRITQEALDAWDRSKLAKARTKRKRAASGANGESAVVGSEDTIEGQTGNPAYFRLALDAMEREAKILGTDAPIKMAPTDPSGQAEYGKDIAQGHRRIEELEELARARIATMATQVDAPSH